MRKIPFAEIELTSQRVRGYMVNGVGDLKAALQYSNHSSIDQYTGHFVAKVAEDVRLGRAFIFPREMASRIPGLRVSPVGVAVSAIKMRFVQPEKVQTAVY